MNNLKGLTGGLQKLRYCMRTQKSYFLLRKTIPTNRWRLALHQKDSLRGYSGEKIDRKRTDTEVAFAIDNSYNVGV